MCIEFDGHHSGGSSFDLYIIFLIILSVGHTHRYQFCLKKKKKKIQVKSPSSESRVPEIGSDTPIGSGRDSGRDNCPMVPLVRDIMVEHGNVVNQYKPPTNTPYGKTYNPNWWNHPNLYCFLDCYSGYFQIEIVVEDQVKTTFTCQFGTYA